MNDSTPLGRKAHLRGFALLGILTKEQWRAFLSDVTQAINMSPVYAPAIFDYPLKGEGGVGQTIIQPITESFIAVDTWPDLKGAYLLVCSCRDFNTHIIKLVLKKYDLQVSGECGHTLRIPEQRELRVVK